MKKGVNMKKTLEEFQAAVARRTTEISDAKANGAKLVQYTGNFIPDELIRAAGADAYPMWRGGEPEPPDAMLDESIRFLNPYARSMVGFYKLNLDPIMEMADLVAVSATDCHVQRMAELLEGYGINTWKVGVPTDWKNSTSYDYYANMLHKLLDKVTAITNQSVDQEKLLDYVRKTNTINDLLRKISALRDSQSTPIGGYEFIQLNQLSAIAAPDTAIHYLTEFYEKAKNAAPKFSKKVPRILFVGHTIAVGDYIVPKKIEDYGALIAYEILDEGCRWYEQDIKTEGDMFENLTRARYCERTPISLFEPAWKQRVAELKRIVKEKEIDGIVWYQLLYDEIYDMEYTCLAKWMSEDKTPLISLQTSYEYTREAMAPLNNRIESFITTLKGGL
jgi:benzoyl-CoA reductase/2-hydroxyglutaryl-CoA dehydratase subunit BcrC/BadD/HgdB